MSNPEITDLCNRFARNELSKIDRARLLRLSKQNPRLRRELLFTLAMHRALDRPLPVDMTSKKEPLRTPGGV